MCAGIYELLKGIKEYGSINASAKKMHMAYNKAWTMLREADKEHPLIMNKEFAGRSYGSKVTEYGLNLMHKYESIVRKIEDEI
jgi:molybdate transport system regulatory protein